MRNIILLMHVSLDGFVATTDGALDWIKFGDDEIWGYVEDVTNSADTALYGENTYRMMESYWPTAAEQPDATLHDMRHAKWASAADKIVFSKTRKKTDWENTRIVHNNIEEEIAKIRTQPGKNLLMLGSPTLAQNFMQMGLIDEFYLNINPVVLGSGIRLFTDHSGKMALHLHGSKRFRSGVVGLHYVKVA